MKATHRMARRVSALLALAATSQAGTFYVDVSLMTGSGDGSSWANAFRGTDGLQNALTAAGTGDQVFVREGTYLPTLTGVRSVSFVLESGLEIFGGFTGVESTPSERPPIGSAPTLLEGDLAGDDTLFSFNDNSTTVVDAGTSDATAILDGFVVRGGAANVFTPGISPQAFGGGIYCAGGSNPTIRNCLFTENRSTNAGAVYINGASPSFTNCQFTGNSSNGSGAGALLENGAGAVFDRCIFESNGSSRGGGMEIQSSGAARVTNSLFYANSAFNGSAVFSTGSGSLVIQNCTIVDNTAGSSGGSALENIGLSFPSVSNCILWGNRNGSFQREANYAIDQSIVDDTNNGSNISFADPEFLDPAAGNYSLSATSPAIDAGDNATTTGLFSRDLAGNPRLFDTTTVSDTGVGTAPIVDIGAFENVDSMVTPFCFGDGSGTSCPCGNNSIPGHAGGCAHASGNGAILRGAGVPSVAVDSTRFSLTNASPLTFGLLVSGDNQLPQSGGCSGCGLPAFDGLRCAGGNFLRHGSRNLDASGTATSGWGPPAGPTGGLIASSGFVAGQTRHFFAFFRTGAMTGCTTGQNSSNGVSVTFTN